jgi:cystathionine beta-lyase
MFDFDTLLDRKGTDSTKWDALSRDYGDSGLLPFWVADMDFKCLPDLDEALRRRTVESTYGYTFASEGYFDSIVGWYARHHNLSISKQDIVNVPGVLTGLHMALAALAKRGDRILINTPVYPPFFDFSENGAYTLVHSPLKREHGRYVFDFDDMRGKLKKGVQFFVLCSPHNPVGRAWEEDELRELVRLCDEYGTFILSDEIHGDLVLPGHRHFPILGVSGAARRISLVASAPSKTFNCAGLKSSFLIAQNEEVRNKVKSVIARYHLYNNLFALVATRTVYDKGDAWLKELLDYLYGNAEFAVNFFDRNIPKIRAYMPEATYLMWLDFSGYGLSQEELMSRLQNIGRVALNSGTDFGEEGRGFARFNIGTPRAFLEVGLNGIASAFRDLQ